MKTIAKYMTKAQATALQSVASCHRWLPKRPTKKHSCLSSIGGLDDSPKLLIEEGASASSIKRGARHVGHLLTPCSRQRAKHSAQKVCAQASPNGASSGTSAMQMSQTCVQGRAIGDSPAEDSSGSSSFLSLGVRLLRPGGRRTQHIEQSLGWRPVSCWRRGIETAAGSCGLWSSTRRPQSGNSS